MIRAIRPNAMAHDDAALITGWNIGPNLAYTLQLNPGSSACGVLLYSENMTAIIASGAGLVGTDQPVILHPYSGQTIGMIDADLGWHLLLTTEGTEYPRTIKIGPAVDLPDEIHPIYADDDLAVARATAGVDDHAHYIDDISVSCPLGFGAWIGDVARTPVDGGTVDGQTESITWTGTPNGTSDAVMVRRHVAIAPEPWVDPVPITPPTVADDTAETDAVTSAEGNVLANDDDDLTIVAVNGLSANVGAAVAGSDGGLFTISEDGAWTFDPDGDFAALSGSETEDTSVTYCASDGVSEALATVKVTVSASAGVTDPHFANVSLLLHCDGPEGSTAFTDVIGNTVSVQGGTAIRTAFYKFGVGSGHFPGSCPSIITVPKFPGFDFGAGDFTIEMFPRIASIPAGIWPLLSTSFSAPPWHSIRTRILAGGVLFFGISTNGGSSINHSVTTELALPVGDFVHLAFVRWGALLLVFIEGVLAGSASGVSGSLYYSTREPLHIGTDFSMHNTVCSRSYLAAYIDEIRVTKGVARYTEAFTPPLLAFQDS